MNPARLIRNARRGIEVLRDEGPTAFVRKTALFVIAPLRLRFRKLKKPYRRFKRWLTRHMNFRDRLNNLFFTLGFVCGGAGRQYGVTTLNRLSLLLRMRANNRVIPTLTTWHQHVILADAILNIPGSLKGDVVECGAFNGASTASLSLVCSLTGRRLFVCDSFEGLPAPDEAEKYAIVSGTEAYYQWQAGEYASEGGLQAVQYTVSRFGKIEVCEFVKGYFSDTLEDLGTDAIVLVFEDADMSSSVRDCIIHLWPKLQEGCRFYCHEPWSTDVVGLFYDKSLWKTNLGIEPPGFFGSGHGLSIGSAYTRMGYAQKVNESTILEHGHRRVHLGTTDYKT